MCIKKTKTIYKICVFLFGTSLSWRFITYISIQYNTIQQNIRKTTTSQTQTELKYKKNTKNPQKKNKIKLYLKTEN